jgi:hypothetical protein
VGDGPGAGGEELGEEVEGVVAVFAAGFDVAADGGEGFGTGAGDYFGPFRINGGTSLS